MKSGTMRILKNLDVFGYPIHLKFEKNKGHKHKTLVGTFMTVVLFAISLFIVVTIFASSDADDANENFDSFGGRR